MFLHSITSKRLLSSPLWKGASMDTCREDLPRLATTSDLLTCNVSASSSGEGARSNSCSKVANVLWILLERPTLFKGKRTIRDCSAKACRMDCLIHHTA